jgi:hypothetical protein
MLDDSAQGLLSIIKGDDVLVGPGSWCSARRIEWPDVRRVAKLLRDWIADLVERPMIAGDLSHRITT